MHTCTVYVHVCVSVYSFSIVRVSSKNEVFLPDVSLNQYGPAVKSSFSCLF